MNTIKIWLSVECPHCEGCTDDEHKFKTSYITDPHIGIPSPFPKRIKCIHCTKTFYYTAFCDFSPFVFETFKKKPKDIL